MTKEEAQEKMYRIMAVRDMLMRDFAKTDKLLAINIEAGRELLWEYPTLHFRCPSEHSPSPLPAEKKPVLPVDSAS